MYTPFDLRNNLSDMGLKGTDTVLLHTSMKAIGEVQGGADTVLDTLSDYFQDGLLCFPALSWETLELSRPFFDVMQTKSIVGILPELFRQRPGVLRSWNPTHSMSALGKDAEAFLADDHKTNVPCGEVSSWHKLADRDAYILMLGCGLTRCTFLHGVEEWCGIPGRIAEPKLFEIRLPDGRVIQSWHSGHIGQPSEQFWKLEKGLEAAGFLCRHRFGDAQVMLMKARELFAFTAGCLYLEPGIFNEQTKTP